MEDKKNKSIYNIVFSISLTEFWRAINHVSWRATRDCKLQETIFITSSKHGKKESNVN
jgi:hypothetical protein